MNRSVRRMARLLIPLLAMALVAPVSAQSLWGTLKHKARNEAEKVISHHANHDDEPQNEQAHPSRKLSIHAVNPFVAGNMALFHQDLSSARIGSLPHAWKTNGSAQVVTVDGLPGKWIQIKGWSTLKLVKPPRLPAHFTIQFDVIAAVDQVRDLDSLDFGFAHDNSVRSYINDPYNNGSITDVELDYMNGGGGSIGSSATGRHRPIDYSLADAANRPMHVAIDVDGDNMKVFVDGNKVADSRQFLNNKSRYFYISYGLKTRHGAAFLFGNFRLDGFGPPPTARR